MHYLIKRTLSLIFNVICIVCLVFIVSRSLPQDQVLSLISGEQDVIYSDNFEKEYNRLSEKTGYNKPLFYFSVLPCSYPDSLNKIPKYRHGFVKMLIHSNGNWRIVETFLGELRKVHKSGAKPKLISNIYSSTNLGTLHTSVKADSSLASLQEPMASLKGNKNVLNNFLLKVHNNGWENQFHQWMVGIWNGNWGVSNIDGRPVQKKIFEGIRWTVLMNFTALLIIFLMGIFLGVVSDYTKFAWLRRTIFFLSFALYAIPMFWLASLLIVFFASGSSESYFNVFPAVGRLFDCRDMGIFTCFIQNIKYLLLPIICFTLPVLAYFIRLTHSSLSREKNQRYVLFLRSQGFSRAHIYFKSMLKNALMPVLTLIGNSLPAIISGSLVIEIIFNIPGTGRILYEGILNQDWNVVFLIVIIAGVLITIGYLITDILYTLFDPRVKALS